MSSKNKGYRFKLGDNEGVLSRDEAVELLRSRLSFVPASDSQQIDAGLVSAISEKYGLTGKPSERITQIAEATINQLSGVDERFTRFTSESLLTLNKELFNQIVDSEFNEQGRSSDYVDQAIQGISAPNGKTFTSVQTANMASYLSDDYPSFAQHFSDVRLPARWAKQEDNLVTPRGVKGASEKIIDGLVVSQIRTAEIAEMTEAFDQVANQLNDVYLSDAQANGLRDRVSDLTREQVVAISSLPYVQGVAQHNDHFEIPVSSEVIKTSHDLMGKLTTDMGKSVDEITSNFSDVAMKSQMVKADVPELSFEDAMSAIQTASDQSDSLER